MTTPRTPALAFALVAAIALVGIALGAAPTAPPTQHGMSLAALPAAINSTRVPSTIAVVVNNTAATPVANTIASIWKVEIDVPSSYHVGAPDPSTLPAGWSYNVSGNSGPSADGYTFVYQTTTPHDPSASIAPGHFQSFVLPLTGVANDVLPDGHVTQLTVASWGNDVTSTDSGGDRLAGTLSIATDLTAPTLNHFTVDHAIATTGLTSIRFDASEALLHDPTVTVNGNAATLDRPNSTGTHYAYNYSVVANDAQGPATIVVQALDLASNAGTATASGLLTLDTAKPILTLTHACAVPLVAGWCPGVFTLSATATDATSAVTVTCQRDDVATNANCASLTDTADGVHRFYANATDGAGNRASLVSWNYTIDATPPTLVLVTPTANVTGWKTANVSLVWNCTDATSGTTTPWSFANVTGEGRALNASATCSDLAGNTVTNTLPPIQIDRTPPVLAAPTFSPALNAAGWARDDVTVTWACTDALSGAPATVSQNVTGEGSALTASAVCTDVAGNNATAQTTLAIDRTAPTIAFSSRAPAANANGWSTSDVTLTWTCADALSGAISSSVVQTVTGEGASLGATGVCTDAAGNTASNARTDVRIDRTSPSVTAGATCATPGTAPWCRSAVRVSAIASDAGSGLTSASPVCRLDTVVVTCAGLDVTSAGAHTFTATASDLAGLSTTATKTFSIDSVAPTLAGVLSPASADGAAGWYRTAPTLAWTTTDATSGAGTVLQCIAATAGCTPSAPATGAALPDGDDRIEARVTDAAGNVAAASAHARVDATPPALSIVLTPGAPTGLAGYYVGDVTAALVASDATSGLHDVAWSLDGNTFTAGTAISHLPEGVTTITARATDNAGNVRVVTQTARVDRTAPTVGFPDTRLSAGAAHALDISFTEPMDTLGAPLIPLGWTGAWSADARTYRIATPTLPSDGAWTVTVPADLPDAHGVTLGIASSATFVTITSAPDTRELPPATTNPAAGAPATDAPAASPPAPPQDVSATISGATATLQWTASTDTSHGAMRYVIVRDGATLATVAAPPFTDTGLTAGRTYTYVVLAENDAGRSVGSAPAAIALPAAADARATTSPAAPDGANGWYVTAPTVTLSPTRDGAAIFVSIDGAPETAYSAPLAIAAGEHVIRYHADGATHELAVRVDSTPPVLSALDVRDARALVARARDAGSGMASVALEVRDASGAVLATARADGVGPNFELALPSALLLGDHTAALVVTDAAGNALTLERAFTITPDMLPTLLKGTLEQTSVNGTTPTPTTPTAPPTKGTPGAPLGAALVALGALALATRRRRQ